MTPHIKAKKGDFAKIVLMPGDPLRAKWIADNFLDDVVQINDVRGMLAFTGIYNGQKISVMGHGMGIPSIGIYTYELFVFYDVEVIIRIGSAGSYTNDINVGDLVLSSAAFSESTYADLINVPTDNRRLYPTALINDLIKETASKLNIKYFECCVHSNDVFYGVIPVNELVTKTLSKVVEMEAFALFANAIKLNKKAACILTCSDSLLTHESMSADDRQTKFKNMVYLALESSLNIYKRI